MTEGPPPTAPLIWITRPAEDAERLADALTDLGYRPLIAPLMVIKNHTRMLEIAEGDALAFTSANGVRAYCVENPQRHYTVFAVGSATAERAKAEGFTQIVEAGGDVAALIECITAGYEPGQGTIHHIAGTVLAGDLAGGLSECGYKNQRHVLYQAQEVETLPQSVVEALSNQALSGAVFYSPRTAALAVKLLKRGGMQDHLQRSIALCLSKAVAEKIEAISWADICVAERPSQSALLASLQSAINQS